MTSTFSPSQKGGHRAAFRIAPLAAACAMLCAGANAQQAAANTDAKLGTVVVTGIRASLDSAMNLKRDSQGVVDGINAEEIGKFPDTNLAESLQRISGVSIERTNGEGSRITVRGVGPDFNMVLLNGRQMPASSLNGGGAPSSRAFDFANLASESIAGIEVYKTSRASTPAGGIGATVNIKTARPLGNPDIASVGFKEVIDTSNTNLPSHLQGKNARQKSRVFTAIRLQTAHLVSLSLPATKSVAWATTRQVCRMVGVPSPPPMGIGAGPVPGRPRTLMCTPYRKILTTR